MDVKVMFFCMSIFFFISSIWFFLFHPCGHIQVPSPYFVLRDEGPNFNKLPDLRFVVHQYIERPKDNSNDTDLFDAKLSINQYDSLESILNQFGLIMVKLKLQNQWFLGVNSLLGSLQHHDIVPWIDGIDIFAPGHFRREIQYALSVFANNLTIFPYELQDRLYLNKMSLTQSSPFVEINYYTINVPNFGISIGGEYQIFKLDDVFPLVYRPFGRHWRPAPRKPINFLQYYLPIAEQTCIFHSFRSQYMPPIVVNCEELMNKFPFVNRCPIPKSEIAGEHLEQCDEYLVYPNGKSIHKIRTVLDSDEVKSLLYTAHYASFECPK
ncbi:hypothetical protein ACTXT7_010335 [Hymenolepis weldensis]